MPPALVFSKIGEAYILQTVNLVTVRLLKDKSRECNFEIKRTEQLSNFSLANV